MTSKVILVTGGSRSGKSSFAENLYKGKDDVLYIATAIPTDKEMEERIRLHQETRNQNWETAEKYKNIDKLILDSKKENILLDCVTVMITNLIFDSDKDIEKMSSKELSKLEAYIIKEFETLIKSSVSSNKNIILVTNEVGSGIVPEYKLSRIFRDIAGRVNQRLALLSHEVYLLSCGLPIRLK